MSKSELVCSNNKCGKNFLRENKEINRNRRTGKNNYCSQKCSNDENNASNIKYVSEKSKKENQKNIKRHCGNKKDKYTPFRYFVKVSKNSNRRQEYNLDLDYLKDLWVEQKGKCPISGFYLDLPKGTSGWDEEKPRIKRASLDRINPKLGYIKGNVRFISWTANLALNSITDSELVIFCKSVAKYNE